MKTSHLSLATLVLNSATLLAASSSLSAFAQSAATQGDSSASVSSPAKPSAYQGVSQPPADDVINATENAPAVAPPAAAPSGTPALPAATAPVIAAPATPAASTANPDFGIVESPVTDPAATATTAAAVPASITPHLQRRPRFNPDDDIVTSVPTPDNQLPEGTPLHARLDQEISSSENGPGTPWSAQITQEVTQNGRVIIPVGSTIRGRVIHADFGHRITGPASLRLAPEEVVLPDGTRYLVRAVVSQTSSTSNTKVTREGAIQSKDHPKRLAAEYAMGGGGGAVLGAELAGPAGAIAGSAIGLGIVTAHFLIANHAATLPANAEITFGLTQPLMLTSVRETANIPSR